MRLEPRTHTPLAVRILAPLGAVTAALALCALLIAWTGAPVLTAYGLLVEGAVGSRFALTETLTRATPLILTGLAAAVAFRTKLWNIGAEGQLYMGALAAVVLGGASISGGEGTIVGTLIGALIINVLNNGLNLMNVNPYSQMIVKGLVLAAAVAIRTRKGKNK